MTREAKRVKELEDLLAIANDYLAFYIKEQPLTKIKWQKNIIKRNTFLLKKQISEITSYLKSDKLSQYLECIDYRMNISEDLSEMESAEQSYLFNHNFRMAMNQSGLSILMKLIKCSPRISYYNDFTWFNHGTIDEHIQYALGKVNEEVFEKYLPYQVNKIREEINIFFTGDDFHEEIPLLTSILGLVDEEKFIPANILTITLVESLVRKFCYRVYKIQNPDKTSKQVEDYIYNSHKSFERLITETKWLKDISISIPELFVNNSQVENDAIYNAEKIVEKGAIAKDFIIKKNFELIRTLTLKPDNDNESIKIKSMNLLEEMRPLLGDLMTLEKQNTFISLETYLDFLIRKFKDDRNKIIHGKYSMFTEKWTTLLYLNALDVLIGKIKSYEKKSQLV